MYIIRKEYPMWVVFVGQIKGAMNFEWLKNIFKTIKENYSKRLPLFQ